jgi:hypothetical protein
MLKEKRKIYRQSILGERFVGVTVGGALLNFI